MEEINSSNKRSFKLLVILILVIVAVPKILGFAMISASILTIILGCMGK